jgi:AcrR family transcriptional regulator
MSRSPSSSQLTPRAREILDVARQLLEEQGVEALSTRRLAERLGIRAPSLYSHFADKQALEDALVADGLWELGDRALEAIADTTDPIGDIVGAYRRFGYEHPHLYRLIYRRPWARARVDPAAEEHSAVALRRVTGGDVAVARSVWAFAHGMVDLELSHRLPDHSQSADDVWHFAVEALKAAMHGTATAEADGG